MNDVNLRLPASAAAPGEARRAVAELDVADPPASDAALLTSELVSNSVQHASPQAADGEIELHARKTATALRVEVCDGGPGFNWTQPATRSLEPGGLGLVLVESLAQRWGVDADGRTCVWFELPISA